MVINELMLNGLAGPGGNGGDGLESGGSPAQLHQPESPAADEPAATEAPAEPGWQIVTATALALPANDASASSSNGVQGGYDSDDGDSNTGDSDDRGCNNIDDDDHSSYNNYD